MIAERNAHRSVRNFGSCGKVPNLVKCLGLRILEKVVADLTPKIVAHRLAHPKSKKSAHILLNDLDLTSHTVVLQVNAI